MPCTAYVRALEQNYEEAEPDDSKPAKPATAPDQRRRPDLRAAQGRPLGRRVLRPRPPQAPASGSYVYGKTSTRPATSSSRNSSQVERGIPVADESWRLGLYLDYWLENVVKPNRRPATYALYETIIRLYLIPASASTQLQRLSVPIVQIFLNGAWRKGDSIRKVQIMRTGAQRCAHPRCSRGTHQPQRRPPGRTARMGTRHHPPLVSRRSHASCAPPSRPALPCVRAAAALRAAPR